MYALCVPVYSQTGEKASVVWVRFRDIRQNGTVRLDQTASGLAAEALSSAEMSLSSAQSQTGCFSHDSEQTDRNPFFMSLCVRMMRKEKRLQNLRQCTGGIQKNTTYIPNNI